MSLTVFVAECAIFAVAFGALVFGMLLINPVSFISDYPPEIQERYYTSRHKEKAKEKLTVIMVAKKVSAMIAYIFLFAWMAHKAGAETFGEGLLLAYGYMLVWAAFDTLVLDFVLFPRIRRVRLPGTEDMDKEYRQKWFHVKAMLPVVPVFAVAGVIIAAVMVRIW